MKQRVRQIASLILLNIFIFPLKLNAQTCASDVVASTPNTRFAINGDGTVTDKKTGLIWKQCHEGKTSGVSACDTGNDTLFTWRQAITRVNDVNSVGFAGAINWRLPNIKELSSIVERACYDPSINLTIFPTTPGAQTTNAYFWASTHDASRTIDATYAWYVNFGGNTTNGTAAGQLKDDISRWSFVRLVRSPE